MSTAKLRAGWRKSSYSDTGNGCVDVDFTSEGVEIRDTKIADSPVIRFDADQWSRWLDEVITGKLTDTNGAVRVSIEPDVWVVSATADEATLRFTRNEITAFRLGAADGEFDPSIMPALAVG
jgi:Domain of unknown function (DUF397)